MGTMTSGSSAPRCRWKWALGEAPGESGAGGPLHHSGGAELSQFERAGLVARGCSKCCQVWPFSSCKNNVTSSMNDGSAVRGTSSLRSRRSAAVRSRNSIAARWWRSAAVVAAARPESSATAATPCPKGSATATAATAAAACSRRGAAVFAASHSRRVDTIGSWRSVVAAYNWRYVAAATHSSRSTATASSRGHRTHTEERRHHMLKEQCCRTLTESASVL